MPKFKPTRRFFHIFKGVSHEKYQASKEATLHKFSFKKVSEESTISDQASPCKLQKIV